MDTKDDPARNCVDNAKDEVENKAPPGLIYDLAGDEPSGQAQHDPFY